MNKQLIKELQRSLSIDDYQKFNMLNTDAERYRFCAEMSQSDEGKEAWLLAAESADQLAKETQQIISSLENSITINRISEKDSMVLHALQKGPTWQKKVSQILHQLKIKLFNWNKNGNSIVIVFALIVAYQITVSICFAGLNHLLVIGFFSFVLGVIFFMTDTKVSNAFQNSLKISNSIFLLPSILFLLISINIYFSIWWIFPTFGNYTLYRVKDGQVTKVLPSTELGWVIPSQITNRDKIYYLKPITNIPISESISFGGVTDKQNCPNGQLGIELKFKFNLTDSVREPKNLEQLNRAYYHTKDSQNELMNERKKVLTELFQALITSNREFNVKQDLPDLMKKVSAELNQNQLLQFEELNAKTTCELGEIKEISTQ